ncbi:unnamed protein product [Toxocara canis]|uniref:Secreted protein n=1 Tax=Toxocara canis TaxID=6265 RepID=A0A183V916_TOXCA|nr:unnamed protein product [Toxocara canis]
MRFVAVAALALMATATTAAYCDTTKKVLKGPRKDHVYCVDVSESLNYSRELYRLRYCKHVNPNAFLASIHSAEIGRIIARIYRESAYLRGYPLSRIMFWFGLKTIDGAMLFDDGTGTESIARLMRRFVVNIQKRTTTSDEERCENMTFHELQCKPTITVPDGGVVLSALCQYEKAINDNVSSPHFTARSSSAIEAWSRVTHSTESLGDPGTSSPTLTNVYAETEERSVTMVGAPNDSAPSEASTQHHKIKMMTASTSLIIRSTEAEVNIRSTSPLNNSIVITVPTTEPANAIVTSAYVKLMSDAVISAQRIAKQTTPEVQGTGTAETTKWSYAKSSMQLTDIEVRRPKTLTLMTQYMENGSSPETIGINESQTASTRSEPFETTSSTLPTDKVVLYTITSLSGAGMIASAATFFLSFYGVILADKQSKPTN